MADFKGKIITKTFIKICAGTMIRLAYIILLYLGVIYSGSFLSPVLLTAGAAVFFFVSVPFHFSGYGDHRPQYRFLLRYGLIRWLKGSLFGILFYAAVGFFLFGIYEMDYKPWNTLIKSFSFAVFSSPAIDTGYIGFFVILMLLFLIYLTGWHFTWPDAYRLPAGAIFKTYRKKLVRHAAVNFLFALPEYTAYLAILLIYVLSNIEYKGKINTAFIQKLLNLIKSPLPWQTILILTGISFLTLPLKYLRKTREKRLSAVLTRRESDET